ncbi:hypothetical protein DXG03_006801 [Asterophora parasitica]|uniref:Hemerythrin-like domain-containing protein n=1 Tax=Asterophora parasitica TaxID=117018 RepID=A0A9P7KB05_9AGAR|nr:hypothetical protein DXG03_006801 [Asterophora parasitica]
MNRRSPGYALSCAEAIHLHHHGEEAIIFPILSTELDMGHNVEQHEAFTGALAVFEKYMTQVQTRKEEYNAEKTRQLLRVFAEPMVTHLHDEIPTISAERLRVFSKLKLDTMVKGLERLRLIWPYSNCDTNLEKHIRDQPFFTTMPYTVTHHDFVTYPSWASSL